MVTLTLAAAVAMLRYGESPSRSRLAVATASTAVASLVKPTWSLFFLIPLFWAVAPRHGFRRRLTHASAFATIAALPTAAYIAYGEYVKDFLRGQASNKIDPALFLHPSFWKGWLAMIADVLDPAPSLRSHALPIVASIPALGLLLLAIPLGCVFLARAPYARRVLVALWGGYFFFGLTFATHIENHNYYSLVLVPLGALSVGAAVPRLSPAFGRLPRPVGVAALVFATAVVAAGSVKLHGDLTDPSLGRAAADYARIGSQIGHDSAIILASDYGEPVEYHGRFRSRWWPSENDVGPDEAQVTVAERLSHANRTYWPAPGTMRPQPRFFVADVRLLAGQTALRRYLRRFDGVGTTDRYVIFDLRP